MEDSNRCELQEVGSLLFQANARSHLDRRSYCSPWLRAAAPEELCKSGTYKVRTNDQSGSDLRFGLIGRSEVRRPARRQGLRARYFHRAKRGRFPVEG